MDAIAGAGIIFGIFYFIFFLGYLGVSIYCLVLFIKLALRGIKALDIYINKNNNKTQTEGVQ